MAGNEISGRKVVTATLTANTVDLVFLTGAGQAVQVINQTGTAPIWFTVSHPGGNAVTPTVNGVSCYGVASVAGQTTSVRHDGLYGSFIQLISTGTPTYTVVVGSKQIAS